MWALAGGGDVASCDTFDSASVTDGVAARGELAATVLPGPAAPGVAVVRTSRACGPGRQASAVSVGFEFFEVRKRLGDHPRQTIGQVVDLRVGDSGREVEAVRGGRESVQHMAGCAQLGSEDVLDQGDPLGFGLQVAGAEESGQGTVLGAGAEANPRSLQDGERGVENAPLLTTCPGNSRGFCPV
jgi:hypothetical protein